MSEFAQLDVKEIRCETPRSQFPNAEVERLAELILQGNGVIRPLVVRQTDVESYLLIEGDLLYHAAVRAREKDPRRGEMVNVFIVSDKQESIIKEQLATLQKGKAENKVTDSQPLPFDSSNTLSAFVTNFIVSSESRINDMTEKVLQTERKLTVRMHQIEELVAKEKQRDLLDLINTMTEDKLQGQLAMYGVDKGKIEAICKARRQKDDKKFKSYQELQDIKGLGAKGLLTLIDRARLYNQ